MTPARKLTEEIRAFMARGEGDPARAVRLVEDYSAICRDVNMRLQQIEDVLESGDERQALLMAERPPPVMDEASHLCFPEMEAWRAVCEAEGLPRPPEIREDVIRLLHEVYAKGIQLNHAIYKEFRSVVLSRDHEAALQLARTIERGNPDDTQAAKERQRLEKKVLQLRCAALDEALAGQDEALVEAAWEKVREIGEKLPETDRPASIGEAEARLKIRRAEKAKAAVPGQLGELKSLQAAQNWQGVANLISRVDEAIAEYGLSLSENQVQDLGRSRDYYLGERSKFQTQAVFEASVRDLLRHIEAVEARCQASGVAPLRQLSEWLATLNREWQRVQSYTKPVEPEIVQRVGKLVDFLRAEIAKAQKTRLLTVLVLVAFGVSATAVGGWWLVGLYRANEAAEEIAQAMNRDLVEGVIKLSESAEASNLQRFSSRLGKQIEEGRAWLEQKKSNLELTSLEIQKIESSVSENFEGRVAADVRAQLENAVKLSEALPKEQQGPLLKRIVELQGPVQEWLRVQSAGFAAEIKAKVARFESDLLEPLKNQQSFGEFKVALEIAEKDAQSWRAELDQETSESPLPPELRAGARGMLQALADLRTKFDRLSAALQKMERSATLEEFEGARAEAMDVPLFQVNEVADLRTAALHKVTPETLTAELVFPWKPEAWKALLQGGESEELFPREILPSENEPVVALTNDQFSTNVYVNELDGAQPPRTVFTKDSPLLAQTQSSYSEARQEFIDYTQWTGTVYDRAADGDGIRFSRRTFSPMATGNDRAKNVRSGGKAPFVQIHEALGMPDFLDNVRVKLSVWELLDRSLSKGATDPVYLAFVAQKLRQVGAVRPYAWGGHFTPSGTAYLEGVRKATGGRTIRSGDWLRGNTEKPTMEAIRAIVPGKSNFFGEARVNRFLARSVKAAGGLTYVGFVGLDGKPILPQLSFPVDSLWGYSGELPHVSAGRIYTMKGNESEAVGRPIPFSPLFAFRGNTKDLLAKALDEADGTVTPENVLIPTLFR